MKTVSFFDRVFDNEQAAGASSLLLLLLHLSWLTDAIRVAL